MFFIKTLELQSFKWKMSEKQKIDKGKKYINLVSCDGVKIYKVKKLKSSS